MMRVSDAKMWSLGEFRPRTYVRSTSADTKSGRQFDAWLSERLHRTEIFSHWRSPEHMWSVAIEQDQKWHRDIMAGRSNYLIIWSNILPTEIRRHLRRNGQVYQAAPREVLMFDNDFFVHQPPQKIPQKVADCRFFARAHVRGETQVFDVPGIFALELKS